MPERYGTEQLEGMTVIELVPSFGRKSFGLGYAALYLSAALHRNGADVYLASMDNESDGNEACEAAGLPRERFIHAKSIGRPPLNIAPFLGRHLLRVPTSRRRLVHAHGLWTYAAYLAGAMSGRWNCPLVLSPHGELEPYALSRSKRRKAIASLLYARRNLQRAACLCVLSEKEFESVRASGFKGRTEVIPNGVTRAVPCTPEDISAFRSRHGIAQAQRILLFLSRIAPKKNLPLLLKALANIRQHRPDWMLVIAGPDERGHIHEVQALVESLGIGDVVRFIGRVSGREKACALSAAALYVLPSLSEGLPIAVLEAMEYAKPVLITDGWSLPIASGAEFGWQAPTDQREFQTALFHAMGCTDQQLADIGRTGRALVRKHFDWDVIAGKMMACYASMLECKSEVPVSM